MIQIDNCGYEEAYHKVFKELFSLKYKINGDNKIAYESPAILNFDHTVEAAELKNGKLLSHYNYDMIHPYGNQQMKLELDYYKKNLIDSKEIEKAIFLLNKTPDTKHAVMRFHDDDKNVLPCEMYQFLRILNGELYAHTHMRANNAYGLLLMDMHLNNAVVNYVANKLGIDKTHYVHFVDALHIYKRDLNEINKLEYNNERTCTIEKER